MVLSCFLEMMLMRLKFEVMIPICYGVDVRQSWDGKSFEIASTQYPMRINLKTVCFSRTDQSKLMNFGMFYIMLYLHYIHVLLLR